MKGQAVIEYMIIFGILLLMFIVVFALGFQKNEEVLRNQIDIRTESLMNYVVNKINTVLISGKGFETEINIPDNIEGAPFTINISSNRLYVQVHGNSFSGILLTKNIIGSLSTGKNTIINEGEVIRIL